MREGSLFLTRPTLFDYITSREDLLARSASVFKWIVDGKLEVRIDTKYDLDDAAQAHRDIEGRKTTGKLLIVP